MKLNVAPLILIVCAAIVPLYWGFYVSCASDSMFPTLTCHNKIGTQFLFPSRRDNLSVGDIVIYSPSLQQRYAARQIGWTWGTEFIIHRIIGKNSTGYIIKGDNNGVADNDIFGNIKFSQVSYIVRGIR